MTDETTTSMTATTEEATLVETSIPEDVTPKHEHATPAELNAMAKELSHPVTEPAAPEVAPEAASPRPVVKTAEPEVPPAEPVAHAPEPALPVTELVAAAPAPEQAHLAPAPTEDASQTPPVKRDANEDKMLFEQALASMEGDEANPQSGAGAIAKGERIEAKVIQVEKDRVFVDLGTKAEGVIPLAELSETNLDTAVGAVNIGDTFEVIVLRTNSAEGNPIVSKKKADFDQTWHKVIDAFEKGTVLEAPVVERVKGGLVVDIGVRGFVPATHVGNGKLRNIDKYVGEVLTVKIIELDRERRKVVLSNRVAEGEKKDEFREKIFTEVKPQDILDGRVRRLTDYGAFVDLGGIDGLLHISEMSWARIEHPREVLTEGQEIKVMVLRLDPQNGRVSLGYRQVLPDPWNLVKENYKLGQKLACKVTRIVANGAFVRLPEGAEAFLPLSEISDKRLRSPEEELVVDQDIEPMIIDLRPDERRMVLSLRPGAVPGVDYGGRYPAQAPGGQQGGGQQQRAPYGAGRPGVSTRPPRRREDSGPAESSGRSPTGGATIGERLGALRGFLKQDAAEPTPEEKPEE